MKESLELTVTFPVTPEQVYAAWLDSEQHTAMTGGTAECSAEVGASFTAWNGYITGKNLSLTTDRVIVQSWRTVEFAPEEEDSRLLLRFQPTDSGTTMELIHTHIPAGQTQYEQGGSTIM